MSNYRIGQTDEWGWKLLRRRGRVELYKHEDISWGVYLYPHAGQNEGFMLHAIRLSEEAASQLFEEVADALGEP